MKTVIDKVIKKKMDYRKAYAAPQTALDRCVKKMKEGGEVYLRIPKILYFQKEKNRKWLHI